MATIGVIIVVVVLAFAIFVWRRKSQETGGLRAVGMCLPDDIKPFSTTLLTLPVRCVLIVGGVGIPLFFFAGLGITRAVQPPFTLFTLMMPVLSFFFAFSYIAVDRQHIAKVFRIGRWVAWEYSSACWKDVVRVIAYESNRDNGMNLKVRTTNGRNVVFTLPLNSDGANSFKKIEKFFHSKGTTVAR